MRLRPRDALGEAFATIVANPARAVFSCIGTLLVVAWFVAALGLASTASGQLQTVFATRLATMIMVRVSQHGASQQGPRSTIPVYPYPADVERRVEALHGVRAVGVYWQLKLATPVNVTPGSPVSGGTGPAGTGAAGLPVIAASPGLLAAAGVQVRAGRPFDAWDQANAAKVCLLGASAAQALGISSLRDQPTIDINDVGCVVIGIVSGAPRQSSLLGAVVLPSSTAMAVWGPPDEAAGANPTVLIQTAPGAAAVVARQAPAAIDPTRPAQFFVTVPSSPVRLDAQVTTTANSLLRTLGWSSLAIGVLAVATMTWAGTSGRAAEFGLRRSFGARRRHVFAQVLAESAMLGLLGGLAGAGLGVAVVVLIAHARNWVPVISPLTVLPAPAAGAAVSALAGILGALPAAWRRPARMLTGSG